MTRFVDLINAILLTWTNLGRTPKIVIPKRSTKRQKGLDEGIVLRNLTDNVVLASNGSQIYADRNGTIEIYALNQSDSDNLYLDIIANFVGYPITYNDLDYDDIRNKYSIFLECSYLEK